MDRLREQDRLDNDKKNQKNRDKDKKRRDRFFKEQNGQCWWCMQPMVHWDEYQADPKFKKTDKVPGNGATVEHLRDRFDPTRRMMDAERRWRIACYDCNHKRGVERQAQQPKELLRERSTRHRTKRGTANTTPQSG